MKASEKFGEASSQSKSPKQVPIDVSKGEEDEALLKFNKNEFQELLKMNSIQCIESMRILPKGFQI